MFWTLLIGICFFTAVGSAWDAAAAAKMGAGGHILAAVTGLVIGALCAFAMWRVGEAVGSRASKLHSESRERWLIRAIYASSVLWIFLAAVLGKLVASGVLKFVV